MKLKIALAGNPNVGKSTIFNALTKLRQHTGNWPGKTVACASGNFTIHDASFSIVDLPGIYSFDTRSEEENIARDYISERDFDCLLLVCDATCLERGLCLLKQAAGLLKNGRTEPAFAAQSAGAVPETSSAAQAAGAVPETAFMAQSAGAAAETGSLPMPQVVLCVNLCDEAEKKGIRIDFSRLERVLGIPVIPCRARERQGLLDLKRVLFRLAREKARQEGTGDGSPAEGTPVRSSARGDKHEGTPAHASAEARLPKRTDSPYIKKRLPADFLPEDLASQTVSYTKKDYRKRDDMLDRFLTGPVTGTAVMCLLLTAVFWLTITGANYPSAVLYDFFFKIETALVSAARAAGLPQWFIGAFLLGVFRVVSWIVSVMLPPMAIFFPLFTLLEDLGYLPRAAFNMDGAFHKCRACGKQCLTMAMGLGCNAAGVVGCRIIDSPRERLVAILTNSLVPCNGRFPLLLTMISLFLIGNTGGASGFSSVLTALALTGFILAGVFMTLFASWLLSCTVLKGVPSSFTLELPPYRRPQIGKVIVRSVLDRTLFVLGRAVAVAAPAGLFIWILANVPAGDGTLLSVLSGFLDPLGTLMGLDGIILMAFILGFPANEIVLPIILMAYLQTGALTDMADQNALLALLTAHGWTMKTAICMAVFSLFHWPCSTTCLTIRKETGSMKWTALAFLLPTVIGVSLCILISVLWDAACLL